MSRREAGGRAAGGGQPEGGQPEPAGSGGGGPEAGAELPAGFALTAAEFRAGMAKIESRLGSVERLCSGLAAKHKVRS